MTTERPELSLLDEAERDLDADDAEGIDAAEKARSDDEVTDRAREAEAILHGEEPEPESLTPETLEELLEPEFPAPESTLHQVARQGRRPRTEPQGY